MRFDRGFISPYFVTDVKSQKVEFEKPLILLSEKKISLLQDVLPSLEAAAQQRRPLLIIAEVRLRFASFSHSPPRVESRRAWLDCVLM